MAKGTGDARLMPVLAVLVLIAIGAAGWLIYSQAMGPVSASSGGDTLVQINAANVQSRRALQGNEQAWRELEAIAKSLRGARTGDMSSNQKDNLADARNAISAIVDNKSQVFSMTKSVSRLGELIPGFNDGVRSLQRELESQGRTESVAQLDRVRLLADQILILAQQMAVDGASGKELLVEREMELQQLVRLLQAGDPDLGIQSISGPGTEQSVNNLVRRSNQIGAAVRDSLALTDGIVTVKRAVTELDDVLLMATSTSSAAEQLPGPLAGLIEPWIVKVGLMGLACVLTLAMLLIWLRGSGARAETAKLVEQTEKDQQAILQLLDELDSLADGDLTVQATVSENITGAIADSVNYAIEALRDLVSTITKGAITLENTTRQTEQSARALASSSEAQGRQVKDASAAVRQMAASIDEVSGNAERSSDVARHSVDVAHKGGDAVRRTIEGMNTIRETIQDTSKRIKRLGESSQEIGDIVELINDIADQTNILALNASIQASMAGEAGRGFAVVADEVQRLAERSANATKQIEVLVSTIQSDTNEAVVSMERSTTDVVGGALLAENAGAALEEIEQVSNQIASLVQNISGSAKEQADDARIVLEAVERLQELSSDTDKTAASTAEYMGQLTSLSSRLRESASGFTLPSAAKAEEADKQEAVPASERSGNVAATSGEEEQSGLSLISDQPTA